MRALKRPLAGPLRFEIDSELLFNLKTGEARSVNALRIFVKSDKGRWTAALTGPICAVENDHDPSVATLLEAAARIVRENPA